MRQGSRSRVSFLLVAIILAAATMAVYSTTFTNDFVHYDDHDYITANRHVGGGLSWEGVKWAFGSFYAANWHPLTWLSHMLDVSLFGMWAGGHHMVNVAIHIVNTLLLFGFLWHTTGRLWSSAAVGALFSLHPLHVESVAWVSERKDVLSTFFWLMAMWGYAFYASRPGLLRYLWVLCLFGFGLLSKPMVVTLPLVLLLLDYWPLGRFELGGGRAGRLVLEKVPLLLMSAASCVVTLLAQRVATASLTFIDLPSRITNAVISYGRYIFSMFVPLGLAPYYPHPNQPLYFEAGVVLALLLAAVYAVLRCAKQRRYMFSGLLWYVITLVPVIGLVQVGGQSHADRYTYIPLTGIFIIVAFGAADLAEWKPELRYPVIVAMLGGLSAAGFMTFRQVGYWKDSLSLYSRAAAVTRNNSVMLANLAAVLKSMGRSEEALAKLNEAASAAMVDHRNQHATLTNLGVVLLDMGRVDEALTRLQEAVAAGPRDAHALGAMGSALMKKGLYEEALEYHRRAVEAAPGSVVARAALGANLVKLRRFDQAETHLREALRLDSSFPDAWAQLGVVLQHTGRLEEAIEACRRSVSLEPELASGYLALGGALLKSGDYAGAAEAYRKTIALSGEYTAYINLGGCLLELGRMEEAEGVYREALRLRPDSAGVHYGLAVVLWRLGRVDEAVLEAERSLRLDPGNSEAKALVEELRGRSR
jgi:tetratricopeptide (TPR) repeat protein